jgi:hypothetical protein
MRSLGLCAGLANDRTRWYRDAKFGMFIHWGRYSLASVEASWPIMTPTPGGIREAEYRELPRRFNPSKFEPHSFIDLARAAGQEYLVFTTKHHDGFCMFDSSYTDYKITNTPYGKDIVRQLADACQGRENAGDSSSTSSTWRAGRLFLLNAGVGRRKTHALCRDVETAGSSEFMAKPTSPLAMVTAEGFH